MPAFRVPTLSIRYALPAIFAILIMTTVGLIGWLAFRSGQQVIDDLATQLCQETTARIEEHVYGYMDTPYRFHQINAAAIRTGAVDPKDIVGMERYLWEQVQLTEAVPFIYYGTEQGEIYGVERKKDGTPALWIVNKAEGPDLNIYRLDAQLNRVELLDSVAGFDPRGRPWYVAAAKPGKPAWSTIYPDISRPILVITAAMPVYNAGGTLSGVLGIDLSLEQISDFMRALKIGQTGRAVIVERTGDIVASSASESPTLTTDAGQTRLNITKSSEPLLRAVGQALQEHYGELTRIDSNQHLILTIEGNRQFVQVTPLQDERGLDWLVVVVIPETDFMGPIYANVRSTIGLGLLILALAVAAGFVVALWIIRPVLAVTDAAAAVEAGQFTPESLQPIATRTDELGTLAHVFQRMAQEVRAREQQLKQQLQQLRIEIDTVKRQTQVDGIVDTDFFRNLQSKAHQMRDKRKRPENKEDLDKEQ